MKFKKVLVATAMVGVLATGVVGYGNQADAKVYLKMDSYYMMTQTS